MKIVLVVVLAAMMCGMRLPQLLFHMGNFLTIRAERKIHNGIICSYCRERERECMVPVQPLPIVLESVRPVMVGAIIPTYQSIFEKRSSS